MSDSEILNSSFFTEFKYHYKMQILYRIGKIDSLPQSTVDFIEAYQYGYIYERCVQLSNNRFKRIARLRARIRTLLTCGDAYFVTLTFSDLCFNTTSAKTRRTYATRFLKSLCDNVNYVANVDYGDKNGREHYHAVVNCLPSRSLCAWWYKYCGIYHVEKIRPTSSERVLALYVDKFKLHNMKVDYNFKTIYSRGFKPDFYVENLFSTDGQLYFKFNNLRIEHFEEVAHYTYPD